MIIEYDYPIKNLGIEKALGFKTELDILRIELEFEVLKDRDEWNNIIGDLNVVREEILYVAGEDGVPIIPSQKNKEKLFDYLDSTSLDAVCWDVWDKEMKLTNRPEDYL